MKRVYVVWLSRRALVRADERLASLAEAALLPPLNRLAQPRSQIHVRFITEQLAPTSNVCQTVLHITRTWWLVVRSYARLSGKVNQLFQQLVQRCALAIGDVDYLANAPVCLGCLEIGRDNIVDVGEIAGLLTVTVDYGALIGKERTDEPGYNT